MDKARFRKIATFLISASITGIIYMGLVYLLKARLSWNPYVSVSVAYAAAMVFYFISNKLVVFKKSAADGALGREIFQFAIVSIVNYLLTLLIVWLFKRVTGEIYSGSVVAGIVTTILAYLVFNRIFIKK